MAAPGAFDRDHMAATRTLLAVVRTGGAIAGGGALVSNLLVKEWPRWVGLALSSAFLVLGYWMMWSALRRGRKLRRRFQQEGTGEEFLFPLRNVTIASAVLQLLLFAVIVLYFVGSP